MPRTKRRAPEGDHPELPDKRLANPMVFHTEFETQDTLPVNGQVQVTKRQRYYPRENGYENLTQFHMDINPRTGDWMDPAALRLHIEVKVTQNDGQAAAVADPKGVIENFFPHTLFKSIKMLINGTPIPTSDYYEYRSLISMMLTTSKAKANEMSAEGFYPDNTYIETFDEIGKAPTTRGDAAAQKKNLQEYPGWSKRSMAVEESKTRKYSIPLRIDPCEQVKMFPPNQKIELEFTRNNPLKSIITKVGESPFKVEIVSVHLDVTFYQLTDEYNNALLKQIYTSPTQSSLYPIIRKKVTFSALTESTVQTVMDVCQGQIPRRIILGFLPGNVVSGIKNGVYNKFEAFGVKALWAEVDSTQYPKGQKYEPHLTDTAKNRDQEQSNLFNYELFKRAGLPSDLEDPYLSYKMWESGTHLYAIDFTPDENAPDGTDYQPVVRMGQVNIHIESDPQIPASSLLMVYSETNTQFEIDTHGRTVLHYT